MNDKQLKCRRCGWVGREAELATATYYEEWGDVSTVKCPECGRMVYEGEEIESVFEAVEAA